MTGPILWCALAAALFGASPPFAKALLASISPLTLAGLLYLGAALGVLPFAFRGGSPARRRDRRNLRNLAGAIVFGGIIGPAALLYGLSRAPSASVSLWLNAETVATAVFAWLLFREHIGLRGAAANLLIVAGGVLLALPEGAASTAAAGWIGLACLCWGLDNNFTALIDGFTPAQSTLAKGLVAGAFNLGAGVAFEGAPPLSSALGGALALGGLSYGASLMLYVSAAHHLGAARSQMIFATGPFLGVLTAWGVFAEPPLALQLAAGGTMAVALFLLFSDRHGHTHTHHAVTHVHRHRHDDAHHDHVHPGPTPGTWHTHEHQHDPVRHLHPHHPDLHHRHDH